MQYYLAVLLGGFLYIGFQLNSAFVLPDFRWKSFIRTNIIPTILNLVIGWTLVFIKDDLENIYPITMFTALTLGLGGQSVLKKIQDAFDPEKKTYITFK